ncbi:NAD(P)/FAD-dependent oxidoreductase [Amycolatopsis sp. GM8]|uniref:NAD(P)/FAD-dependent oxidoreductase n=1 Tax=Amycolatopsis sp. GM8 TaxID=2896530 RepID=UPI001F31B53F|nr:FAD-dependent oxidoreductase [Amycolatopsis sp. GM8]
MNDLVVVGASLAGLRAVEAARAAGFGGRITLIGAEPHLPYDRPPLSKQFLDEVAAGADEPSTVFHDEAHFVDELGVTLRLGEAATALDPAGRRVILGADTVPYDAVVIATGAHARTLPAGRGLAGVHALRTVDDAHSVRRAMDTAERVVVIGAGFIGSEVAASARKRGLPVTIVEALATPLVRAVGPELGLAIAQLHAKHGTDLRCGAGVERLLGEEKVTGVRLTDGTELPADLVVVGVGADPATGWLEGAGLTLDNGVVCDEYLCAAPGVYAAGDVARWHNPLFGRLQRLEHWTSAAGQGEAAARNALDPENAKPYLTVPYFWSDWYDSKIQFVGIPDADETRVVDGDVTADRRWIALYRQGDRIVGALAVNGQADIMKYRRLISERASWQDGLDLAERRRRSLAAKSAEAVGSATRS